MTPEEEKEREKQKRKHISTLAFSIKRRAKEKKVPYDVDTKYLIAIAPDYCPVFKKPLIWGYSDRKVASEFSPSLDRVIPEKGYVRGNVAWVSNKANSIKSNATAEEIYAVAEWLHQKVREIKLGGIRPPGMDDPAFTYLARSSYIRVVNDEAARDRGGY